MPDRKSKPYHPRHFPDAEDPESIEGLVIGANNSEYELYHSGTSQDVPFLPMPAKPGCPHCGSARTESKGRTKSGSPRRLCLGCGRSFVATTGCLLSYHKLPMKAVVRFFVNLMTDSSVNEASKVAKISMKTAIFWLNKAFYALRGWQDSLTLRGTVYLDDKLIDVEASKKAKDEHGNLLKGRNQWNVGIAKAGRVRVLILQGRSKSSAKRLAATWRGRIAPGSALITDGDRAYSLLAEECGARSWRRVAFTYRHGDQCRDLQPINTLSSNVEAWFRLHCGMEKSARRIQDYLNLLAFKLSCPGNALKRAQALLEMVLKCKKTLRYRQKLPTDGGI